MKARREHRANLKQTTLGHIIASGWFFISYLLFSNIGSRFKPGEIDCGN